MRKTIRGFTIVELIVVIVVIGILATIGIISFSAVQTKSRDSQRASQISIIQDALENYYSKNGEYPSCKTMSALPPTVTATLTGLDPSVLKTPTAASGANSIQPSCSTELAPGSTADVFAYVGNNNTTCLTASGQTAACTQYTLEYREEATGQIKKLTSRHISTIVTFTLTTSVSISGGGTVTPNGVNTYNINSTVSITAAPSAYYSFDHWDGNCSGMGNVATITMNSNKTCTASFIATPIIPNPPIMTVVNISNTTPTTTTWSWPSVSCGVDNSVKYQYDYLIDGASRDPSGWKTPTDQTATSTIPITTSTGGHDYSVKVRVQCYNSATFTEWSDGSNLSTFTKGALTSIGIIAAGSSLYGITISPDGKSVYVVGGSSSGSGSIISMYSRNTSTGVLTALSPVATIAIGSGNSITISSDGKSVYVIGKGEGWWGKGPVYMYSRNTSTGVLTALSPVATIATDCNSPNSITISHDGRSVYVTNDEITISPYGGSISVSMYSRNTWTGVLTALSPATIDTNIDNSHFPRGITISPDDTSVYVAIYNSNGSSVFMYSRNTSTGALTIEDANHAGAYPNSVIISSDGTSVYVLQDGFVSMYSRNTSTGVLTALVPIAIATGANPWDITISSDGTSVYVANYSSNSVSMFSRNTSTGALTALSPATITTDSDPQDITISPDGTSVYVTTTTYNPDIGNILMFKRN